MYNASIDRKTQVNDALQNICDETYSILKVFWWGFFQGDFSFKNSS